MERFPVWRKSLWWVEVTPELQFIDSLFELVYILNIKMYSRQAFIFIQYMCMYKSTWAEFINSKDVLTVGRL